jgi:hypothetical protein
VVVGVEGAVGVKAPTPKPIVGEPVASSTSVIASTGRVIGLEAHCERFRRQRWVYAISINQKRGWRNVLSSVPSIETHRCIDRNYHHRLNDHPGRVG